LVAGIPDRTESGAPSKRRIALPGHAPRALAVFQSHIYVAEYFSDTVAVVDLRPETDEEIRTIKLGPPPLMTARRRGEFLFHSATICYQHWQSCATCHPDGRIDALNWDLLNDGMGTFKNTKSLLLAHQTPPAMAEGVRDTAEAAVRSGLEHILFADRPEEEAAAIDAYLAALQPVPSPHLVQGQLSPSAARGQRLFESRRINCDRCHPAPLYSDLKMHDVGTRSVREYSDRFDTPTLIEVWRTAPYLHDGRYTTIRQVLVEGRHGLSRLPPDVLSDEEIDDLVAFVLSL
jgi:cytochrome c peroxidase